MGTNGFLLARAADISLSLKDTYDVMESPSTYNNERIQQFPKKTPAGQKSHQAFGSEGNKSKDTIKLNVPIAHWTIMVIAENKELRKQTKVDGSASTHKAVQSFENLRVTQIVFLNITAVIS